MSPINTEEAPIILTPSSNALSHMLGPYLRALLKSCLDENLPEDLIEEAVNQTSVTNSARVIQENNEEDQFFAIERDNINPGFKFFLPSESKKLPI